jgi:hypothetical protein
MSEEKNSSSIHRKRKTDKNGINTIYKKIVKLNVKLCEQIKPIFLCSNIKRYKINATTRESQGKN